MASYSYTHIRVYKDTKNTLEKVRGKIIGATGVPLSMPLFMKLVATRMDKVDVDYFVNLFKRIQEHST